MLAIALLVPVCVPLMCLPLTRVALPRHAVTPGASLLTFSVALE